jgi:hypothetical protein
MLIVLALIHCLIAILLLTTEFGKRDPTRVDFMATLFVTSVRLPSLDPWVQAAEKPVVPVVNHFTEMYDPLCAFVFCLGITLPGLSISYFSPKPSKSNASSQLSPNRFAKVSDLCSSKLSPELQQDNRNRYLLHERLNNWGLWRSGKRRWNIRVWKSVLAFGSVTEFGRDNRTFRRRLSQVLNRS